MRLCLVVGTRPDIIKMSPIILECTLQNIDFFTLHTGQHYSHNMDSLFFKELKLPQPKYNLGVGVEPNHRYHVQIMIDRLAEVLAAEQPNWVLVYGDTNSALAATLAANRLQINIAHIEAGLRSFDIIMAEEVNRMLCDHLASLLFTPTKKTYAYILNEGIPKEKVIICGNTVVDAVLNHKETAKTSKVLEKNKLKPKQYFLVTAHRPETVDIKERLTSVLEGLSLVGRKTATPLIFPVHPRTKKMLDQFELQATPQITFIEPLGYLDFLHLQNNARLILTDSGGIQEEACSLGVPCVTLRENTERPETLEIEANALSGTKPENILSCVLQMLEKSPLKWDNPYGNGQAAKTILKHLTLS
jgi:UDP-N-acetylglucosamine 2-epimerase (non-hydrolysing)